MLRQTIVITAAVLALAVAAPSEAAKRKEGLGVSQCWIEGTANPAGPGEAISSCCLDDGCWICSATWNDCVWEPKVGAQLQQLFQVQPNNMQLHQGGRGKLRAPANVTPGGGTKAPAQ